MKEGEKMDKGGRGVPRPHTGLNYSLTLKSYTKYKIDRDRNIAHNTDKNRNTGAKSTRHMYHCS